MTERNKHIAEPFRDILNSFGGTMATGACETPMSDHVARFWNLLETEHVRILIDIRRDHDDGQPHWDSASFPDEVAKGLVADREVKP